MTPTTELATERRLIARIGAHTRWSAASQSDRLDQTEAARRAWNVEHFENLVDPHRELSPEERARRAANARKAHMAGLALKSARVRRERRRAELEREALADVEAMQEICPHTWPDETGPDAECPDCGLAYIDWSDNLGGAA